MLQQIQQFRKFGEEFAMQHKDSEYLGEVEEELQMAVLEAIPAERYARRLRERPNDELQTAVLEAIPTEKRVRGLSPEEVLGGLSEEQVTGFASCWNVGAGLHWFLRRRIPLRHAWVPTSASVTYLST